MRPRCLKIEGLQSFKEEQTIDFDMLGATGLFGIFGPTGSGKSTILDAITLALYGNVQRASRGTQGIINMDANHVRVSFTFDLVRHQGRKTYRVDRLYKKKKGTESTAEAKVARLFEVVGDEEIIMADKEREVTTTVVDLVGLEPADFTRSVVLPQNKFQEFLLLDKAKKRDMMERIFYLEEYGRKLTEKINKRLSAVRHKLSNLEGAITSLGDVSEKILVEAESNLQKTRAEREKIDAALKQAETEYHETKQVWELVREQNKMEEMHQKHTAGLEEIKSKKIQYEKAIKADTLVENIKKYGERSQRLEETETRLGDLYKQLSQLEAALKAAQADYEQKEQEAEEQVPVLIEQKAALNHAKTIKQEIGDIDAKLVLLRESYTTVRKQIKTQDQRFEHYSVENEKAEKDMQAFKQNIEILKIDRDDKKEIYGALKMEEELQRIGQEAENRRTKVTVLSNRVAESKKNWEAAAAQQKLLQDSLEGLKAQQEEWEKQKPGERAGIMQDEKEYHLIRSIYDVLHSKKAEQENIHGRLSHTKAQLQQQKDRCQRAEAHRTAAAINFKDIQGEVEQLKQQYEKNTAYILAKRLKGGGPCPVCGSEHHPNPADASDHQTVEEIGQRLRAAQEKLEDAEKDNRAAEKDCIKLAEQLKSSEEQITSLQEELTVKQQEYDLQLGKLPKQMRHLKAEQMAAAVTEIKEKNDKQLKAIEEWEKSLEVIKKKISDGGQRLSEQNIAESTKKAELELNGEHLIQAQKDLDDMLRKKSDALQAYEQLIKKLDIESGTAEYQRIEHNERRMEKLQKQMEALQKEREEIRGHLEKIAAEKQQLLSKYAEIETDGKHLKEQRMEKEQKIKVLLGEQDIEQAIHAVDQKVKVLQTQAQQFLEKLQKTKEQVNQANVLKSTLENQKEIYARDIQNENQRLEKALRQKGFKDIQEAERALLSKEQEALLHKEIQTYEEMMKKIEMQKELINRQLNGRNVTEEEWDKISLAYVTKKQEKEDSISQYESAKNQYHTIKDNFEKWMELDKEYRKHIGKKDRVQQIQKLMKGNSFVEFISEERLRYVAKEASETLGILTKYRYAIELDIENGFVIRDHANGGVCRSVSTLSGGETFLTSLSLALALSKQIQLKGQSPLEFFFLDEGFGTLDANLLDAVIDALQRLSTADRVIGLISHVPELKNRMARRLIVDPPEASGIGSRVKIEKA